MVEETRDELRRIERDELVHGACRQALLGERRRGDGAGGDEHGEILRADALDERDDGQQLAHAGAMHPNQGAARARQARFAAALGKAGGVFLAARQAPRQEPRRQRRRRQAGELINSQRERQMTRHAQSFPCG